MNGHEFFKKIKKYGKANNLTVDFVAHEGKGSHGTLYLGGKRTILKDRNKEIGSGLLRSMLADLGIDPKKF